MKKIAALQFLVLLAGCGNYSSVRVPYYLPEIDNAAETKKALSSLYIAVKAPPETGEDIIDDTAGGLQHGRSAELNANDLAAEIASAFSRPGAKVLAYRVFRTKDENDPYMRYFDPSGVLEIRISDPVVSVSKENRSKIELNAVTQKWETVNHIIWIYSASLSANIRLLAGPGGKVLDKLSDTFACTEERTYHDKTIGDWYAGKESKLFDDVTAKLSGRYLGRAVLRARQLFKKKGDPESAGAADLAQSGKWSEAEKIWSGRLKKKNDWRDLMDLAVAAETRKDYSAARSYYLDARKSAAGDKEAGTADWKAITGDLDIMLSPPPAARPAGNDWFAPTVALLPFSDETTSIDGPPMLRTLLYESLREAGYRLQPLEETDKLLLSHGLTQGGQLGAVDQTELCKWLGVERLFYGDINEFGEVVSDVFNRCVIKGRVMLWDLKAVNYIWGLDESVSMIEMPNSFGDGMFSHLASDLMGLNKNKPLAYEAALFSVKAAGALPSRAGVR